MFIEALEEEAKRIRDVRPNVSISLEDGVITGAGDSYASCLALEGVSRGRFRCVDPYDLLEWDPPHILVIVSVSGRPIVYQWLLEKFSGRSKIYVVTANTESRIANQANEVVEIPYTSKIQLPGTLSFVSTLKTLYALAGIDERDEKGAPLSLGHEPFFVGRAGNYGIAYFASLKMFEIFGEVSNAERFEQFLHSPIFSTENRMVILLSSGNDREKRLTSEMKNVSLTECTTLLCNTESVILSLIQEMRVRKWDRIYYLENKNILRTSSNMIY
ncbi:hypothetical protein HA72_0605 [Metallosphaera sedula]|uniref:Sugar isomerase (SIS) n=3 Tax=Metallosphaera TaxID=41980 RepID=A4YEC8_METS5|nr:MULTISPECIES: hypothetical protein [Metallosphaera]ABP94780.1 hypothetical protein Msed_0605 [Metallosphaera sedula DSM 5348]AIM26767.1 hypothetical protein HA72_0605 [Metallosphaera sedula]AKV73721.1 hypothetical protein MsedA_0618 [Metallosphaera sedula]AKV75961.1 hypothetical protein MsedB_0618 [Metallosphaera sedula]AKV78212.1 hypothetical protein MsedC_0617 [Metallosphaera sedula]